MHRSWIIKDNAGAECNSSCIVPLSIQLYAAKGTAQTPCVLKDSSSRARALSRQKDTEISRNAFLGISFYVEGCQTHLTGFLPLKMFFLTIAVIFSLFLTNFKDAKQ